MVDRAMNGVYPILSMPFDEQGRIDVDDLQREVDFAVSSGVEGIGIAMASEVFKLSETERDLATRTVVDRARRRVKVVVHTGAQGTDLAIRLSRRAEELGADAVMATPPTTIPIEGAQVRGYFQRISEAIDVPIFVQDIVSAPVPPSVAAMIARESENACYAKIETPPTPLRMAEAMRLGGKNPIAFGGAGGQLLLEELRRGSVGTMPGCAIPDVFHRAWELNQGGHEDQAARTLDRYGPLLKLLGQTLGVSYHLTKEVLRLRGVFKAAHVRQPCTPPDDMSYVGVRRLVESLGLEA